MLLASFAVGALRAAPVDRLLFLHIAPLKATLFIAQRDGSAEHPLGTGAMDYNPAWSPVGDWIVFTSERAGPANLWRMHPDGSGLERLTDANAYDDQAAISPDGGAVVFVSTRAAGFANLWVLDLATHKARPLTTGNGGDFRPAWSPDGHWIAFSSDRDSTLPAAKGRWERLHVTALYIIHPDGTGLKRISPTGEFYGSPKWLPDSQGVVAAHMSAQDTWTYRTVNGSDGQTELVRVPIADGAPVEAVSAPGVKLYPAVLRSGALAWVRRRGAAPGVYYDNGAAGPAGMDLVCPSWSPDGTQVVYSRYQPTRNVAPRRVWSRSPRYELYSTGFLPASDPTQDRFAVTMIEAGRTALYVVRNGHAPMPVLDRPGLILAPQWSADGQRLVFGLGSFASFLDFEVGDRKPVDPVNGGAQVAMVNADGTAFETLTTGPNNNAFPSFAPDRGRIVYRTAGPAGQGLRILDLKTRTITTLTDAYDNFPVWSPRGDRIAFIRRLAGNFNVFTIRPDGRELKQLTNTVGNDAHVAWSPDGERLVFTSSRLGFKDEAVCTLSPQPYGEIFVMRYDGTELEQLTDNAWEDGGPGWWGTATTAPMAAAQ